MSTILTAYEAEIEYKRYARSPGFHKIDREGNLWEAFKKNFEAIPSGCVFCDLLITKIERVHFTFQVIDKTRCESSTTMCGSYSWSTLEFGMTNFNICFACCHRYLPRTFEQLSYDLRGISKSNLGEVVKNEVYVAPEILELLQAHGTKPN